MYIYLHLYILLTNTINDPHQAREKLGVFSPNTLLLLLPQVRPVCWREDGTIVTYYTCSQGTSAVYVDVLLSGELQGVIVSPYITTQAARTRVPDHTRDTIITYYGGPYCCT